MRKDRIYRIGEKMISLDKAVRQVEKALDLRERGVSQQEAANRLQLDRSFLSRLESIGEIRKGSRVAVIGFPLSNAAELSAVCSEHGFDFFLLLSNLERWNMVQDKQALDFFNTIFELVTRLRQFDTLIMITSDKWHNLAEALLDLQIIHLDLGPTPIENDRTIDPEHLRDTLKQILPG